MLKTVSTFMNSIGAVTSVSGTTNQITASRVDNGVTISLPTIITTGGYIANKSISTSVNQGAFAYGTLGYSDINIYSSYTSSPNAYTQKIVQNTNSGAAASVDFVVSNDLGSASTYYGDFGVTSSGYNTPGQNIINSASTVYLQSVTMPLAIGTLNSNALSFYTNSTLVGAFSATGLFSTTNDITVNGITIGKGNSAIASNTAIGNSALSTISTASGNTGVGQNALRLNSTGNNNTALGNNALQANTVGGNTAVGYNSLNANTTGLNSVGVGAFTLQLNTTGAANNAIGSLSLQANTTGSQNNTLGYYTLQANTTGGNNCAIGAFALQSNIVGNNNIGIGFNSLNVSTGNDNTALGYGSGSTLTTGTNNIIIGKNANASAVGVNNEITIGNNLSQVIRYPHNYGAVSALPSASTVGRGARTFVTDALAPVFQATVTGGGAVFTPVYSDGTNWKIG